MDHGPGIDGELLPVTNPYNTSIALAPAWTPSPLTWRQIALGITMGVLVSLGVSLLWDITSLRLWVVTRIDTQFAVYALQATSSFLSVTVATMIGGRRVFPPLLLLKCLTIFYVLRIMQNIAPGMTGADEILASNLPGAVVALVAMCCGALAGYALFKHRRRAREGAATFNDRS